MSNIDPLQSGANGILEASAAAQRAADDIARATFQLPPANDNEPTPTAPQIVDGFLALGQARVGLFASAETIRTADEMIATLLDR